MRISAREQLQRALGELGEVLPRRSKGDVKRPAAGWYARVDDKELYLGDHTGVAFIRIGQLHSEHPE